VTTLNRTLAALLAALGLAALAQAQPPQCTVLPPQCAFDGPPAGCPCGPGCDCGHSCNCTPGDHCGCGGTPAAARTLPLLVSLTLGATTADGAGDAPGNTTVGTMAPDDYAEAMRSGRPFACWVGTDCPECRQHTPDLRHVLVRSLPGFEAPCCVIAFPGGGGMQYYESEILRPPFSSGSVERLARIRLAGGTRPAYFAGVPAGSGAYATSGDCATCGGIIVTGVPYTAYGATYGVGFSAGGGGGRQGFFARRQERRAERRGGRGGCASCGG
jgi:hypothetical protein